MGKQMRQIWVLTFLSLISYSSSAFAAVTYTYTGPNFNQFSSPAGNYDGADRVTGSFTLNAPLAPNSPASDISGQVLSYSFSDNVQTLINSNSVPCATNNFGFRVGTDASGNINQWGITLCTPVLAVNDPVNAIFTIHGVNSVVEDVGISSAQCDFIVNGVCTSIQMIPNHTHGLVLSSGTWAVQAVQPVQVTPVPTLSEWGLIALALMLATQGYAYLRRNAA